MSELPIIESLQTGMNECYQLLKVLQLCIEEKEDYNLFSFAVSQSPLWRNELSGDISIGDSYLRLKYWYQQAFEVLQLLTSFKLTDITELFDFIDTAFGYKKEL